MTDIETIEDRKNKKPQREHENRERYGDAEAERQRVNVRISVYTHSLRCGTGIPLGHNEQVRVVFSSLTLRTLVKARVSCNKVQITASVLNTFVMMNRVTAKYLDVS